MKTILVLLSLGFIPGIICPPVKPQIPEPVEGKPDDILGLEYERYLREVFSTLEEDEGFRKKITEDQVKTADIASQLEYVSHHVRTKLDEIKRREIERLKELTRERLNVMRHDPTLKFRDMIPARDHVDHKSETFEIKDLDRLIAQASKDLEEVDKRRREEFKEYEIRKEHERREKLKHASNAEEKAKLLKEYEELKKKHKDHEKIHEPGHKAQLQEVWEKDDEMDPDSFDPVSFFKMHDHNNDGALEPDEVEALMMKELDKKYDDNNPEDDPIEKYEEMSRMREHVYSEVDKNKNGLIEFEEFMNFTKTKDFDDDETWTGPDEEDQYTEEELAEWEKQHPDEDDGEDIEHEKKPEDHLDVKQQPAGGNVNQMGQQPAGGNVNQMGQQPADGNVNQQQPPVLKDHPAAPPPNFQQQQQQQQHHVPPPQK